MGYEIRIQEAIQTQLIPLPSNRPLMQSTQKNYSPFGRVIKRVNAHMISDEKMDFKFQNGVIPFYKKRSNSENNVSVCHFPFV